MRRKMSAALWVWLVIGTVHAQDFWLQPKKFRLATNEEMNVSFVQGDNFDGEPWDLRKNKILKLDLTHLAKAVDLRMQAKADAKVNLKYKLTEEGTYLLSLQSSETLQEREAAKFNDYITENGLEDALEARTKANTLDQPAREFSSRWVKLLLQAGGKTDDTFRKKTGMRLEIIPEQNPYLLKAGGYLQCLVLFNGQPRAHQLVKVVNLIGNTAFQQNNYTENDGTIKFPIASKGPWMVSTVVMIPSGKPGADWQTFWGNLVFGIE